MQTDSFIATDRQGVGSHPETDQTPVFRSQGLIRPYHSKLLAVIRVLDGASIFLSLWLILRGMGLPWQIEYMSLAICGVLLYELFAEYNEVYYFWRGSPISKEALRILASWFLAFSFILIGMFLLKITETYSRVILVTWFVGAYITILIAHSARRYFLKAIRRHGANTRTVAIVGCTELGRRLASAFETMPWLGYRMLGFYEDRVSKRGRTAQETRIVGNFETLYQDAQNGHVEIIYVTLPMKAEARIIKLFDRLADTTASVYFVPDLFVFDLLHARWNTVQGIPMVSVYETPFHTLDASLKRLEDIVLSSLILMLISVPMAMIAVGVKLSSRGPIIYRQKRYGAGGDVFDVYKFRTMVVHDDKGEVKQAQRNDPRVTAFGSFLRRYSLDELPQFINVLQGRMSIVGPRPHAISHNEHYRKRIHGYMLRHKVRPGITGLAQISGYRGETDTLDKMEGRIRYDLEYIRHWSLLLDLKIILLTVFHVFKTDQGY